MKNIDKNSLAQFLKSVYTLYGHDFVHYNHTTLRRRIKIHGIKLQVDDFLLYSKMILNDKKHFDDMFEHFSINVTEFFREPKQLKIFRDSVLKYLNTFSHLKIWCAGCSSGESPYSLAMILDEMGMLDKCQIYATDFNNRVLAHAKEGLFEINDLDQSTVNYQQSGGIKEFKDYFIKKGKYYKIKKYLKEHILFFNHNLVTDGVMNEFQLIICKNVVIYFNEDLKESIINLFDKSLVYNGFLILGESEYLPSSCENRFVKYVPKSKVYHKKCR